MIRPGLLTAFGLAGLAMLAAGTRGTLLTAQTPRDGSAGRSSAAAVRQPKAVFRKRRRSRPVAYAGARELAPTVQSSEERTLPPDLAASPASDLSKYEFIQGRRVPDRLSLSELDAPDLEKRALPLPAANTLSSFNLYQRRFGRLQMPGGRMCFFNPEIVLVKFRDATFVAAIRVKPGRELRAVRKVAARSDVETAGLDTFETRQAFPDDPLATNQWHHLILGSANAWAVSQGQGFVRIAIVDTPFQMDHPDLAAHVAAGWDVDLNVAVTNSAGIDHSTLGAGLAAAVINNGVGVAGMGDCTLVPININGSISDMCEAVYWAATNGIRVVNISWTGGDDGQLNAAGEFLETNSLGLLVMAGGNTGTTYTTNQPDIYCITMTDSADQTTGSQSGPQVDFAAPGWDIFSTLTGGGYGFASGTSYSAPVFAGVVGVLMSINPTLGPNDIISILKSTAVQPNGWTVGQWNQFYGWGRINFAAAAVAAQQTLPFITGVVHSNGQVRLSLNYRAGVSYALWRAASLNAGPWRVVTNAILTTNGGVLNLVDPDPGTATGFYRVEASLP